MYSFGNLHTLDIKDSLAALKTASGGLKSAEAARRFKEYGPNIIADKNGRDFFIILAGQFKSPLIYILAVAGAVSFMLGDMLDAWIIIAAMLLNAAIGFFQEWRAMKIIRGLKKLISYRARVFRDGRKTEISAEELVPGDLLMLRHGDRVPADGRLVKISDFSVNEATLTGESLPSEKTIKPLPETISIADRKNMVFMGTFVEDGWAEVAVTATGGRTELGKIAFLVEKKKEKSQTPLKRKINSLAKKLGILFISISGLLFLLGVILGQEIFAMFLTSVAVAVAAVPESLPVAISVTLALGARKILAKGGLVKRMLAAETLGETTVIAADKTATLTEGKMRITQLSIAGGQDFFDTSFKKITTGEADDAGLLALKLLLLLTDASIDNPEDIPENWQIKGRPIDKAVLYSVLQVGQDLERSRLDMPRLGELPFSAKHRCSAVLNRFSDDQNVIVALGAPETILGFSRDFHGREFAPSTDQKQLSWFDDKVTNLTSSGFKVLALAYKYTTSKKDFLGRDDLADMTFLTLVALSDPVRKEVGESIRSVRLAGIRIIMLTGDHKLTAEHVAKELGILTSASRSIEGVNLPGDLSDAVYDYDVFARVTPGDKVKIVEALKKNRENVAMIGDGVNDAPSLIGADIGVAVGSGTDVAKEASDLVLLNDSFSIIAEAIKQGRIILANIKKALVFLLSSAFSEIILITGSVILGLPLALLPAQILWVNIIVDAFPAIALAFEGEDGDIMKKGPERRRGPLLSGGMRALIAFFAAITDTVLFLLFFYLLRSGSGVEYARTMTFVGLGLTSLIYIFSVKSLKKPVWRTNPFSNKFLNFGFVFGVFMYILAIYFQPLQKILNVVSLSLLDWLALSILGIFNILVIEICKTVFLREED